MIARSNGEQYAADWRIQKNLLVTGAGIAVCAVTSSSHSLPQDFKKLVKKGQEKVKKADCLEDEASRASLPVTEQTRGYGEQCLAAVETSIQNQERSRGLGGVMMQPGNMGISVLLASKQQTKNTLPERNSFQATLPTPNITPPGIVITETVERPSWSGPRSAAKVPKQISKSSHLTLQGWRERINHQTLLQFERKERVCPYYPFKHRT